MSIASEITRIKTNIANAYTACGNKGGTLPQTQNSANLAATISNISGSENITWHQCPEAARNYLAYVAAHPYDPDDYSTTCVDSYAPQYQNIPDDVSAANSKPIGKIIDNMTFYDNEPNVAEPFSTANKSGTLTALDKLRWYNTTIGAKLDGSNYKRGLNCRDLGGWDCDGGTVRYGVLIRGGEPNPADKALMVDKIGVKTEVQLLPVSEQATAYKKKSVWGIDWAGNDTDNTSVYGVDGDKALWKKILSAIIGSVVGSRPVFFHCGVGADRTGIVAIILEGLLGVGRSDIDQDFELTDFAIGWHPDANNNNLPYRSRKHPTFKPVMDGIKAVPLVGGLSDTFRNHCISFALSLGITIDEINAFRAACIDGTPDVVTVNLASYSVTKSGGNIIYSNTDSSVTQFQGYETELTPEPGYVIDSVSITMGGTDMTNTAFSGDVAAPAGTVQISANGKTDVSSYKYANVNVPSVSPSGTKIITDTALADVANYANAQVVDSNLSAGNIKKDVSILGITGTYEGSGGGSAVNCKIFSYTSAAAVANQDVTVVSGDADVAAHYADANAMVTVRKMTNNSANGTSIIVGTNHDFGGGAYGYYLNCNGTTNAAANCVSALTAASSSGVSVRCNANGDIIVHCMSKQNNFGGADYIITFTW